MKEIVGFCETCNAKVRDGDACHYTADGCWLCEEHAPMLGDAIRQHSEILAAPEFDPGALPYDSPEEMQSSLRLMEKELQERGDKKLLVMA